MTCVSEVEGNEGAAEIPLSPGNIPAENWYHPDRILVQRELAVSRTHTCVLVVCEAKGVMPMESELVASGRVEQDGQIRNRSCPGSPRMCPRLPEGFRSEPHSEAAERRDECSGREVLVLAGESESSLAVRPDRLVSGRSAHTLRNAVVSVAKALVRRTFHWVPLKGLRLVENGADRVDRLVAGNVVSEGRSSADSGQERSAYFRTAFRIVRRLGCAALIACRRGKIQPSAAPELGKAPAAHWANEGVK